MIKLYVACVVINENFKQCSKNSTFFFKNIEDNYAYAYCEECFNIRKYLLESMGFIRIIKKEYVRIQKAQILR